MDLTIFVVQVVFYLRISYFMNMTGGLLIFVSQDLN